MTMTFFNVLRVCKSVLQKFQWPPLSALAVCRNQHEIQPSILKGRTLWLLVFWMPMVILAIPPSGMFLQAHEQPEESRRSESEKDALSFVDGKILQPGLFTTDGYSGLIKTLTLSPDGRTLVSAGDQVWLWDLTTLNLNQVISSIEDDIEQVSFSPDGKHLAINSWDSKTNTYGVEVWAAQERVVPESTRRTGSSTNDASRFYIPDKPLWTVRGEEFPLTALAYAADGKRLIGTNSKKVISIWEAHTGRVLSRLGVPSDNWSGIWSISRDGRWIACEAQAGETIELRDTKTGKVIKTLGSGRHLHPVSLNFSPDSKLLAMGGGSDEVELWDVSLGKLLSTLKTKQAQQKIPPEVTPDGIRIQTAYQVRALCFSPDGQTLVYGNNNEVVAGWDIRQPSSPKELWSFRDRRLTGVRSEDIGIAALTFTGPDVLAKATVGGDLSLWDVAVGIVAPESTVIAPVTPKRLLKSSPELITRLVRLAHPVNAITYSPNGQVLFCGNDDSVVRLHDTRTGRLQKSLFGHTDSVSAVRISSDGKTLASVGLDRTTRVWDIASGKAKHVFRTPKEPIHTVDFSPVSNVMATAGVRSTIRLWEQRGFRLLRTLRRELGYINVLRFSPDGKLLASGGEGGVYLWNVSTGKIWKRLGPPELVEVTAMAFSPDGKQLFTDGTSLESNSIYIWNVASGASRKIKKESALRSTSLHVSPDGKMLAFASDISDSVTLVDLRTSKTIRSIHSGALINTLTFSPGGGVLAVGTGDGYIQLASTKTGEDIASFWMLPGDEGKPYDNWIVSSTGDKKDYYDSSVGAAKWMRWYVDNQVFLAEKFQKDSHRPDLISQALSQLR